MANKIQVKRGVEANIPILDVGEPAFTTDTKKLFIGTDTGNMELATKAQINTLDDEVKSQLAQKIDEVIRDESIIRFYADGKLVEAFSIAEAGNSSAVQDYIDTLVSNGQIDGVRIGDRSVTPKNTTFIKVSSNLYNYKSDIKGYNILDTGEIIERTGYSISDFYLAKEGNAYYFKGFVFVALYDAQLNFIAKQSLGYDGRSRTAPDNVKFMRVTYQHNVVNNKESQINEGSELLPFEPFYQRLDGITCDKDEEVDNEEVVNTYPFKKGVTFGEETTSSITKEDVSSIIEAFKDIKLYGAKQDAKYHLGGLRARLSDNATSIHIYEGETVVARYSATLEEFKDEWVRVDFEPDNLSGITGYALVNWSKFKNTFSNFGMTYEQAGLDERTYMATDRSLNYSGNQWNLRDYYWKNILDAYQKVTNKLDYGTLSFSIITDPHIYEDNISTKMNIEATSFLTEYYGLDFMLGLGDYINGDLTKWESAKLVNQVIMAMGKYTKAPIYIAKGNHDDNGLGVEGMNDDELREKRFYNDEFHKIATRRNEKYDVVLDEDYPTHGYFYKDFNKQKIRMIVLNSNEMRPDPAEGSWSGILSRNQLNWVANKALRFDDKDIPQEWATVIAFHIPQKVTPVNQDYGVHSVRLDEILHAYLDGTSGTITGFTQPFDYDFTNQGQMELIGLFHGHVHQDSHQKVDGINYFVSTHTGLGGPGQIPFTETSLSANVVIINRETRTVNVAKVGHGEDFEFTW